MSTTLPAGYRAGPEPFGRWAALATPPATPRYVLLPNRGTTELENELTHSKERTGTFSNRGEMPVPRALLRKSLITGHLSLPFANRYYKILEVSENKHDDLS
jgi:hypothetical protein